MNNIELHDRASDKAFAKLAILGIEASQLKRDIEIENTGGITIEELVLMHKSTLKEIKVWNFISELIEKSNRDE
jgi:hypothetical protein